jgi:hypothetical protein
LTLYVLNPSDLFIDSQLDEIVSLVTELVNQLMHTIFSSLVKTINKFALICSSQRQHNLPYFHQLKQVVLDHAYYAVQ